MSAQERLLHIENTHTVLSSIVAPGSVDIWVEETSITVAVIMWGLIIHLSLCMLQVNDIFLSYTAANKTKYFYTKFD
jgi:cytochrome c biogenesis protein CcdA